MKTQTQWEALKAIQLAIKHLGQGTMVSSARLALTDATYNLSQGDWDHAYRRALDSISYSVGMFHQNYQSL